VRAANLWNGCLSRAHGKALAFDRAERSAKREGRSDALLRRLAPGVAVMQAADPGKAHDVGRRHHGTLLDLTAERRVLAEAEFCQGLRKLVRVGSIFIDLSVAITWAVKVAPRSKIMNRGAISNGKASRSCWATQAAVGLVVTAQRTTSRRPWRMMKSTWKTRNVAVGTEKKSMAAIPFRWFRRNVVQVCPALGARGRVRR